MNIFHKKPKMKQREGIKVNNNGFSSFIKKLKPADTETMSDFVIALVPLFVWAIYCYGARSAVIVSLGIVTAVLCDSLISSFVLKKRYPVSLSAVVTGGLIAFCLPVSAPLWVPIFGSAVGICFGKAFSGGTGKNIFNPAACGICISYILFGSHITLFTKPFVSLPPFAVSLNNNTISANHVGTALAELKEGRVNTSIITDSFYGFSPDLLGCASVLMIVVAMLYLVFRKKISLAMPFAYFMTIVAIMFFTAYADSEPIDFVLLQLLSGGVALVSVFMLSDYATVPVFPMGKVCFGIVCGALTVAFRYYGMVYYGEFFAVLISNMLVPVIDKITTPRVYGGFIKEAGHE